MALRYYKNAPATTLASGITNSAVSMTVSSVTGLPVSYPYTLIIDRGEVTEEIVEVTGATGTILTITRAVDSSTAFQHTAGATVEHGISARDIREANSHIFADDEGTQKSSDVHGVTGDVVGTTDTQTLTNKTLTSPVLNTPTINDATIDTPSIDTPSISNPTFTGVSTGLPPTGTVFSYIGSTAPTGFLMLDGAEVSRTVYADLFALIGTDYGVGDGSTTFNLPDATDKTLVGAGGTHALGDTGGASSVTLTTTELPAHTHTINHDHPAGTTSSDAHSHTFGFEYFPNTETRTNGSLRITDITNQTGGTGTNGTATTSSDSHSHSFDVASYSGSSGSAGSGSAFSVQNPFLALNHIIKY